MKLRTLILWPHLIAGVTAGVVILLMCVTGVLLTYERQLVAWSDRGYRSVAPTADAEPLPVDELLARVRAERPDLEVTGVTVRPEAGAPVRLSVGREGWYADAYTGTVLGPQSEGVRAVMSELRAWHRWIGVEGEGRGVARAITGWSNLLFLFIVVSGIYLWLPRTLAQLRQNTWFRRGLRGKARDFNWHNVIGSWLAIPLFLVVISALPMSFPWANAAVYRLAGDEVPQGRRGGGPGGGGPGAAEPVPPVSGLDGLVARAAAGVPGWTSITLQIPTAGDAPVSLAVDRGDGGQPQLRSTVTIDPVTGALTHETFEDHSPGRQLRSYTRFGHTGEVLGMAGQTVAGLASAGGAVLVWTGLALAWRRFRAWLGRGREAAGAAEVPRRDVAA